MIFVSIFFYTLSYTRPRLALYVAMALVFGARNLSDVI